MEIGTLTLHLVMIYSIIFKIYSTLTLIYM